MLEVNKIPECESNTFNMSESEVKDDDIEDSSLKGKF